MTTTTRPTQRQPQAATVPRTTPAPIKSDQLQAAATGIKHAGRCVAGSSYQTGVGPVQTCYTSNGRAYFRFVDSGSAGKTPTTPPDTTAITQPLDTLLQQMQKPEYTGDGHDSWEYFTHLEGLATKNPAQALAYAKQFATIAAAGNSGDLRDRTALYCEILEHLNNPSHSLTRAATMASENEGITLDYRNPLDGLAAQIYNGFDGDDAAEFQ